MNWPRLIAATLALYALAVAPMQAKERVEFDFRVSDKALQSFTFVGTEADSFVKRDEKGLRFNVPKERKGTDNVGVELSHRIRGDFDMVLNYELLEIGNPGPQNGAGVVLRLVFDTPSPLAVQLTRLRKAPGGSRAKLFEDSGGKGEVFGAARITKKLNGTGDDWLVNNPRAADSKGRLRLVRTGTELHYWVMDGNSEYHRIRTDEIGTSDVKTVRLLCTTGNNRESQVAVDMRVNDFMIDADQFTIGVPVGTSGSLSATSSPLPTDTDTPNETAGHRGSLVLVLLLFVTVGILFVASALLFYLTQKRNGGTPAPTPQTSAKAPQEARKAPAARTPPKKLGSSDKSG
jgi:Protein of unknown function (DUF1583)